MTNAHSQPINPRALKLLKAIVERYIRDGQPVGSKVLAQEKAIAMSSATIRNIMADLEEAGLLASPHTSAGRVPTMQGYRLFVDSLMTVEPFADSDIANWRESLAEAGDAKSLIASASSLLSSLTHLAGIVTLPKHKRVVLHQVEFLPLSDNRVLVILVLNNHEIQNRIIYTDKPYAPNKLKEAANYLTAKYSGKELAVIRQMIMHEMRRERQNMELIAQSMLDIADQAFANDSDDYVVAGETNLLDMVDETGIDQLRSIFAAFSEKRDVLHLLDKCLSADGVQIYIGDESGYQAFESCSLVTQPYQVAGETVGVLGVIGPTRMSYDRVVSAVDITAKLLSAALKEKV